MDSEEFFLHHKEFRGKTGIYVLESPLKFKRKSIYKLGYAYQSLYKRIRDYKTAYGPVPFKIYVVMEIPERIFGMSRTMSALGTEKRLHEMLKVKGNAVMIDVENGKLQGEWFYKLDNILEAVNAIRIEFLSKVISKKEWLYFEANDKVITRRMTENIPKININSINSTFKNLKPRDLSKRKKKENTIINSKDYILDEKIPKSKEQNFMRVKE